MHVRRLDQTMSPRFRLIAEPHPALRLGDRDRLYGYIDRDVHSNVWPGPGELMAPHANPWFCIDDPEAEVLGRYCINGLPALAMKEQPPAGGCSFIASAGPASTAPPTSCAANCWPLWRCMRAAISITRTMTACMPGRALLRCMPPIPAGTPSGFRRPVIRTRSMKCGITAGICRAWSWICIRVKRGCFV